MQLDDGCIGLVAFAGDPSRTTTEKGYTAVCFSQRTESCTTLNSKGAFSRFAVIFWPPLYVSARALQVSAGHKDYREGGGGRMPDLL